MNLENIWMQVSMIAIFTMLILLIDSIITELRSSRKAKDMLLSVKEYLSKEHFSFFDSVKHEISSAKSDIKNDISQASKNIDSLNAAFSNLLLEHQEAMKTIKKIKKEIDVLKKERNLALQSKEKSSYKDND